MELDTVYAAPQADQDADESWWSRYKGSLGGFTETARKVLEIDCRYVVDRGVFGSGEPGGADWPEDRSRRGLVMGSVQSGKTASMLGSIAMALDRGVDVVVVLAGTRVALWQQTLDRIQAQLDVGDLQVRSRRRMLLPKTPPTTGISVEERYAMSPLRVARALEQRQPIIIVALKNTMHLQSLAKSMTATLFPEVGKLDRSVHLLVVDDEADDGSVLDAKVEANLDPFSQNLKQIPRAIVDLWSPPGRPAPANLYATYLAYTATPQANFLQEDHNPLAPRDFLVALRTPLDRGQVGARSSTYSEPRGIGHYYTGGEVYYRRGRSAGLTLPVTGDADQDLGDALRAFLVAGAVRLNRNQDRKGPMTVRKISFKSLDHVLREIPKPHSMLVHPSSSMADHFRVAEDILIWAGASSRSAANAILRDGGVLPEALSNRLAGEENAWSLWLDRYRASADALNSEFSSLAEPSFPDWETTKGLLISEVIPGTRVLVVNSDPDADDRPLYDPTQEQDGTWRPPRDMSSIFVSGNVMARGLTLEGLTTTLFLRQSELPRADTQMQMQRWFGYRGAFIDLCRLFAPEQQIDFFSQYHDVDEALRNVIAGAMESSESAPRPVVLQGQRFLATGKIANLGTKPLHPGRKPFVRPVNSSRVPDPNAAIVAGLFRTNASVDLEVGGLLRGRILEEPIPILEAADLLDSLSFENYAPGRHNQMGELWTQVESRIAAVQPLPAGFRLYRPKEPQTGATPSPVRRDCHYSIAAYLRLWEAAASRHVRGLFDTDGGGSWAMADLAAKHSALPRFWVGIRYGGTGARLAGHPFDDLSFKVRATAKSVDAGEVSGTWGSNDPSAGPKGFRGDEFFDYYHRRKAPPPAVAGEEPWRPTGDDGLILFYVNQDVEDDYPTLITGVCLPLGGPDQFAAVVASSISSLSG